VLPAVHRQFETFVDQSPSGLDRLWTFGYPSGPLQIFCVHQPRWKPYRSIKRLTVLPLGLDRGHCRGCPSAKLSGFKPKRVAPGASPEGSSIRKRRRKSGRRHLRRDDARRGNAREDQGRRAREPLPAAQAAAGAGVRTGQTGPRFPPVLAARLTSSRWPRGGVCPKGSRSPLEQAKGRVGEIMNGLARASFGATKESTGVTFTPFPASPSQPE
jgi:hypothetical protein